VGIKFSWFQIGLSVIQTVIFIQTAFLRTNVLPPKYQFAVTVYALCW